MFFEEEEVNKLTECPHCKHKLSDPRVIPCGLTVCHACISESMCESCGETHAKPPHGHTKNQIVSDLIQLKAREVYRGPMVSTLKSNLTIIRDETSHIEASYKTGAKRIKDHCDFVRHELELATKSIHQQVNNCHQTLANEIDAYEHECLRRLDEREHLFQIAREKLVTESHVCLSKWNDLLKRSNIDDSELDEAIQASHKRVKDLEKQKIELKHTLFNGTFLKFEENLSRISADLIIGSLHFESLKLFSDKLTNLKSFNLESKLKDYKRESLLVFELLHNGNLVVAYEQAYVMKKIIY